MSYKDEYHSKSMLAYDGKMIEMSDALARYERDKQIQEKYVEAKRNTDIDQLTWDEVEDRLSQDL